MNYDKIAKVMNQIVKLNAEEYQGLIRAIREWQAEKVYEKRQEFRVNQVVQFKGKPNRMLGLSPMITGRIERINRKTATVIVKNFAGQAVRWRVAIQLLKPVTAIEEVAFAGQEVTAAPLTTNWTRIPAENK